jgi:hypothetical protein
MTTHKFTTMAHSNNNDEVVCTPCASTSTQKLTSFTYTFNPENDAFDSFCVECGLQIHETL